jgi:hypothetical protein
MVIIMMMMMIMIMIMMMKRPGQELVVTTRWREIPRSSPSQPSNPTHQTRMTSSHALPRCVSPVQELQQLAERLDQPRERGRARAQAEESRMLEARLAGHTAPIVQPMPLPAVREYGEYDRGGLPRGRTRRGRIMREGSEEAGGNRYRQYQARPAGPFHSVTTSTSSLAMTPTQHHGVSRARPRRGGHHAPRSPTWSPRCSHLTGQAARPSRTCTRRGAGRRWR